MADILDDIGVGKLLLFVVGFVAAAFVHEGGHAVAGALAGVAPRVVNIGVGRPWFRAQIGRTWLVLRIGLLAAGWNNHEPSDRRWALAVLVAGGPLANLVALGVLYAITLAAPAFYDGLEIFGLAEACAVALTLFPAAQTLHGRKVPTDGLRLFRLLVQGRTADLGALNAGLLGTVQPEDAPPHPLSRHSREILYQALRQDRWREAWACRDAVAGYRALLEAPDLTAEERAFVLCELVVQHLVLGYPAIAADDLGAWAARACELSTARRTEAVRGAALVAAGQLVEGKSILLDAVVAMKDRGQMLSATSALAHASLGKAAAGRAVAETWFDAARTISRSLAVGPAVERSVSRMEKEAYGEQTALEAWRVRLKRWLAGLDLP